MKRLVIVVLGLGILGGNAVWRARTSEATEERSGIATGLGAGRLLGPVRHLAAGMQWIRFEAARSEGRYELSYARAESALRLAPDRPEGWQMLANHFAYERGEAGTGRSIAERRAWLQAAFETLELGARAGLENGAPRSTAELRFSAGLLLVAEASLEPADIAWPGGAKMAWKQAAELFELAAEEGHLLAPEAARLARENMSR